MKANYTLHQDEGSRFVSIINGRVCVAIVDQEQDNMITWKCPGIMTQEDFRAFQVALNMAMVKT